MIISYYYYRRVDYYGSFELCNTDDFDNRQKKTKLNYWISEVDAIEAHPSSGRFLLSEAIVKTNVPKKTEYQIDLVRYLFEQKV